MNRTLAALLFLILSLSPVRGNPAAADEIWLDNGRRLEGKLRDLGDGRVEIRASFGTLELGAHRIARVERSATLAEMVDEALARVPEDDAQIRYELALWAREQGDHTLARRLLEEALEADPDHAAARRELGYRHTADGWLTEEQYHARRGEVRFRGAWVPEAERDRALARETAGLLVEAERQRRRTRELELASELARLRTEVERQRQDGGRADDRAAVGYAASPLYPFYSPYPPSPTHVHPPLWVPRDRPTVPGAGRDPHPSHRSSRSPRARPEAPQGRRAEAPAPPSRRQHKAGMSPSAPPSPRQAQPRRP